MARTLLTQAQVQSVIAEVLPILEAQLVAGWRAHATGRVPRTFLQSYVESIKGRGSSGNVATVGIRGSDGGRAPIIALMMELGKPEFNLRETLLQGKEGRNIPMEKTESMVKTYINAVRNEGLSKEDTEAKIKTVTAAVVAIRPYMYAMGEDGKAHSVDTLPRDTTGSRRYKGPDVPKIAAHHDTHPLDGMMAPKAVYQESKVQSSPYMIIRRITKDGDPAKWKHRGFLPLNVADDYVNSKEFGELREQVATSVMQKVAEHIKQNSKGLV